MTTRTLQVDDTLLRYIDAHSLRELPAQAALREATRCTRTPACRSAPTRGSSWRCWCA